MFYETFARRRLLTVSFGLRANSLFAKKSPPLQRCCESAAQCRSEGAKTARATRLTPHVSMQRKRRNPHIICMFKLSARLQINISAAPECFSPGFLPARRAENPPPRVRHLGHFFVSQLTLGREANANLHQQMCKKRIKILLRNLKLLLFSLLLWTDPLLLVALAVCVQILACVCLKKERGNPAREAQGADFPSRLRLQHPVEVDSLRLTRSRQVSWFHLPPKKSVLGRGELKIVLPSLISLQSTSRSRPARRLRPTFLGRKRHFFFNSSPSLLLFLCSVVFGRNRQAQPRFPPPTLDMKR